MLRVKSVLFLTLLVVSSASLHAQRGGVRADVERVAASIEVVFTTEELRIIREHYAARYQGLPPGLRKKYARTGTLPPGWQRKFEQFPLAIERRLPVLPPEYRRGVIDGHAVVINRQTNLIVEVAVLF